MNIPVITLLAIIVIVIATVIIFIVLMTRYKTMYKHYHNELHNLQFEYRNLRTANNRLQKSEQRKDNYISKLEYDLKVQCNELEDERRKTSDLQDELAKSKRLEDCLKEKEEEICSLRQKISELESLQQEPENISSMREGSIADEILDQIELLKRRNEQLETEKTKLREEVDKLNGKLTNKENTISILNERIKKLEENVGVIPIDVTKESLIGETEIHLSSSDNIKDDTKRTIDTVIDVETGKEIYAEEFFSQSESVIFKKRMELQKAIYLRYPKFICKYCGQKVKISGMKKQRGKALFFSHLRDSDDCDYKTTTGRTKKEIEREKYSKCNEGDRHKKLKELLADFLLHTTGVTNVRTEKTMQGNHPILNWRRPDIAITYRGQEIIFELQLSSTFVSVITERDLFYRLNKKFIIWVFNFDSEAEHVDITNMIVKDVYYNHRLNIFIFDEAARIESSKRGELVLKCNWIKPDGNWEYENINNSDTLGGKFVSLNDLTYSTDFKPYYYDAERDYFAQHPNFRQSTISIEEENKRILADLDKIQQQEEKAMQDLEVRIEELKNAYEIDDEIKRTQKYLIGRQDGKVGLIAFDGDIKIPFEYGSVIIKRNWIEAQDNNTIVLYSKNNYEKTNEGIKYEPIGEGIFRIAKYIGEDILWGLIDKRGENITDAKYSSIEIWQAEKQQLLVVKNGKYGVINYQGIYILNCKYDFIGHYDNNNFADITFEGKAGKIDRECKFVEEESKLLGDSLQKIRRMGNWGIENIQTRRNVVECKYDELASYRGNLLGIKDSNMEILNIPFHGDCPATVKLIGKNERGMMIFKIGSKEALMNLRQQQKARMSNINLEEIKDMYVSFVNIERNLLYLSALPIKPFDKNSYYSSKYTIGDEFVGTAEIAKDFGWIFKLETGATILLHRNMVSEDFFNNIKKGMELKLRKKSYDEKHKKDIWEVVGSVS